MLKKALAVQCAKEGIIFEALMEEVATMRSDHKQMIDDLFGDVPVLIHAADWGVVQRARYDWGVHSKLLKTPPHPDWEYFAPGKLIEGVCVLRWKRERLAR